MARIEGLAAALVAALAFCACGIASAQEVAPAQDTPESRFLRDAVRGNVAEIKFGQLAEQGGHSEGARELGETLVEDHSRALRKTAELADDLNLVPPALPSPEHMQQYNALARLPGAEFDRQFVAEMVKRHQEAIAKYEQQAQSGDSKVAKLAEDLLPTLEEHLEAALRLQSGGERTRDRSRN